MRFKLILLLVLIFLIIIYLTNNKKNDEFKITIDNEYILNKIDDKYSNKKHHGIFFDINNFDDNIPNELDLREKCPDIYDQSKMGSCHINASCFLYHYITHNLNIDFIPSRMFCEYNIIYNKQINSLDNFKFIKNKLYYDSGALNIEDINTFFINGICDDRDYPYPNDKIIDANMDKIKNIKLIEKDLNNNNFKSKLENLTRLYNEIKIKPPGKDLYIKALNHKITDVYRIKNNIIHIKKYLFNFGPIMFGFRCGNIITELGKIQSNLSICDFILQNENLKIEHKNIIIKLKELFSNILRKFKNNWYFKSNMQKYSDELKMLMKNDIIAKLFKKYGSRKDLNFKISKENVTLKWPYNLIKESENIFKKFNIDINRHNKILNYLLDNNLPNKYINDYEHTLGINDEIQNKLLKTTEGDDITDFIKFFNATESNDGHSLSIVGYTDKEFIIRNSWGNNWGDNGHCYIEYEYFDNDNLFWGHKVTELYCLHNTTDGSLDKK